MKVSIITATYNSAATVADTLRSVEQQDYPNVEHIIVDGKSSDNTLDIVRGFPHVARVLCERDNGIYDAMNKGIRITTGDIIGILNSDDLYQHGRVLSQVVKTFQEQQVDAVYGDMQYVRKNDVSKVTRTWKAGQFSRRQFFLGWMPPHPTFFVRKEVYQKAGLFDLSLRSSADYEFMLRALLRYNHSVSYIPETLVRMRTGGMSNASFRNRIRANMEDRRAWTMNHIKPYFFTIPFKPVRKLFQFIRK